MTVKELKMILTAVSEENEIDKIILKDIITQNPIEILDLKHLELESDFEKEGKIDLISVGVKISEISDRYTKQSHLGMETLDARYTPYNQSEIDRAVLTTPGYLFAISKLKQLEDKEEGYKPKKDKRNKYRCGRCSSIINISNNYCSECGSRIKKAQCAEEE